MVLVGEDEQLGRDATQACGIECSHALVGIDAIVQLSVDAEDGGVPLIDETVGRVLIGLAGVRRLILVPIGIVVLPVREEHLLGVGIHGLEVEGTVMGDEALEALIVMASEVIDAETSERGSNGSQAVFVDIGQVLGGIVNSSEIVVHALASPVAGDFFAPLRAEPWQTVAVGCNNDIAL